MKYPKGQQRVIITNVQPQVQQGQFPAKVTINQPVVISADVFTDGHDDVSVRLVYKQKNDKKWMETSMVLMNNDHWEATFTPDHLGDYQYEVHAWVDHFTTWQKGLTKKFEAGQDLKLEFAIGAELLSSIKAKDKSHQKALSHLSDSLNRNEKSEMELMELVSNQAVNEVVRSNADKASVAKSSEIYVLNVERELAAFSTWYELFPRSASKEAGVHGTFKDVIHLLPRVKEMGFNVLYLPPIHPIGRIKRKGKNNSLTATETDPGSPWAIGNDNGGHKSLHPQLGTEQEFVNLVQEAEKQGLSIALDIAFQCAPDHPYVKEHPDWFRWRPDGTVQYAENPPKKYEDILPLNFETADWQGLWEELKSVFDHWISLGVSVFRIDNPHTKSFYFWEWVIKAVRDEHPEVIFLAEAFTRPRLMERLAKAGFTQSYTYFTWRESKRELEEYMKELTTTEMQYYMRPNFWPNTPDILPKHLVEGGDNAHIIRLLLAATLSSNYGIYGPVYEFGINEPHPGKEEYTESEKYEIKHWDWNARTRIDEVITNINAIRKENKALQSTNNISFATTSNDLIICYVKRDKVSGNTLIIVVNLDSLNTQSANVHIPMHLLGRDDYRYEVEDLLSGAQYTWIGENNFVELHPHEMPGHVFRVK